VKGENWKLQKMVTVGVVEEETRKTLPHRERHF
jgi:hypothetical protein